MIHILVIDHGSWLLGARKGSDPGSWYGCPLAIKGLLVTDQWSVGIKGMEKNPLVTACHRPSTTPNMGINSFRFWDEEHQYFICTICHDVADDPVMANGTCHAFCRKCTTDYDSVTKCPSCFKPFLDGPKWIEMNKAIARSYHLLRIKCINPSCTAVLDVKSYQRHDRRCETIFKYCPDCGHKSKRTTSPTTVHSCEKQNEQDRLREQSRQE